MSFRKARPQEIANAIMDAGGIEIPNFPGSRSAIQTDDKRKARCFRLLNGTIVYVKVKPRDHDRDKAWPIVVEARMREQIEALALPTLELKPKLDHGSMFGRFEKRLHGGEGEISYGLALWCASDDLAALFRSLST